MPDRLDRFLIALPLRRFAPMCMAGLLAIAVAGLPVFIFLLVQSERQEVMARSAIDAEDTAQAHPASTPAPAASPAPAISPTEMQKSADAAVDAAIKRDELLLDKMLLLVGGYSAILTFLALATVFVSWREAREQLASVRTDTGALSAEVAGKLAVVQTQAAELAANVRQELESIRAAAAQDVAALKREVTREFPIVSRLQNRVLNLIESLEAKYPEVENLNRPKPDSWNTEQKHQDTLIDEAQILAISVVVLDQPNLVKLYLLLSKSYLEQFRTGALTESDAARAFLYARRAIECDRSSAEAFRMRGLVALARYDAATPQRRQSEEFRNMLQQAKQDFQQCKSLDPSNAGAYYNLALIALYEGNLDEAIRLSEELLAERARIPRTAKEKYFPDVFINLACFLADKANTLADGAAREALYQRILTVCTEAKEYLTGDVQSSKANDNFKTSLTRELGEKGDFAAVPEEIREALKKLL